MKTCWLHVGFHKTASTSFQQTCKANINLLRELGFHYPLFSRLDFTSQGDKSIKKNVANHSTVISSLFLSNPLDFRGNLVLGINDQARLNKANQIWNSELVDCLNVNSDVIISGESISTLPPESISKLVDLIKSYDFRIKPFGLVRTPYSALCSGLQERIKSGQHCPLVQNSRAISAEYVNSKLPLPKKSFSISNLLKVFESDLELYPFTSACKSMSQGPVGFLLSLLGINDVNKFSIVKSNESKSNAWVRVTNLINKQYPKYIDGKLNKNYFIPSLEWSSSGKFFLTKPEFKLAKKVVSEENIAIKKLLGSDYVEEKLVFSQEIEPFDIAFMAFEEISNILNSQRKKKPKSILID